MPGSTRWCTVVCSRSSTSQASTAAEEHHLSLQPSSAVTTQSNTELHRTAVYNRLHDKTGPQAQYGTVGTKGDDSCTSITRNCLLMRRPPTRIATDPFGVRCACAIMCQIIACYSGRRDHGHTSASRNDHGRLVSQCFAFRGSCRMGDIVDSVADSTCPCMSMRRLGSNSRNSGPHRSSHAVALPGVCRQAFLRLASVD